MALDSEFLNDTIQWVHLDKLVGWNIILIKCLDIKIGKSGRSWQSNTGKVQIIFLNCTGQFQ